MPTRRGWRTHQNASTRATKSGTRRRSRQGRKLRNSASANDAMMVLVRTGMRICELLEIIAGLFRAFLLQARAARLFAAALLRLGFVGPRRSRRLDAQHQHVAAAVDARRGPADDARKGMLGV